MRLCTLLWLVSSILRKFALKVLRVSHLKLQRGIRSNEKGFKFDPFIDSSLQHRAEISVVYLLSLERGMNYHQMQENPPPSSSSSFVRSLQANIQRCENALDKALLLLRQPRKGGRVRLRRIPLDLGDSFRYSVHRRISAGNHKQVIHYFRWRRRFLLT